VRSLTATHSISGPVVSPRAFAARNMLRPMRPNPLMPTRTGIQGLQAKTTLPGLGSAAPSPGEREEGYQRALPRPLRALAAARALVDVAVRDRHVDVRVIAVAIG